MSFDPSVLLPSENICAFRYGVSLTRGYVFVIGRQYFIEIKDLQNKIFKIKLKSLYGIKRETYYKKWSDIFNQLWRNYFSDVLNYYTELYNIHQIFELAGVKFLSEGISWDNKNKLLWEEIALSNYRTYFMIHHIQNPNQNKSISFSTDWNAFILQSLLRASLKTLYFLIKTYWDNFLIHNPTVDIFCYFIYNSLSAHCRYFTSLLVVTVPLDSL